MKIEEEITEQCHQCDGQMYKVINGNSFFDLLVCGGTCGRAVMKGKCGTFKGRLPGDVKPDCIFQGYEYVYCTWSVWDEDCEAYDIAFAILRDLEPYT
jgi:hypothetical protein